MPALVQSTRRPFPTLDASLKAGSSNRMQKCEFGEPRWKWTRTSELLRITNNEKKPSVNHRWNQWYTLERAASALDSLSVPFSPAGEASFGDCLRFSWLCLWEHWRDQVIKWYLHTSPLLSLWRFACNLSMIVLKIVNMYQYSTTILHPGDLMRALSKNLVESCTHCNLYGESVTLLNQRI